MSRVPYSNVVGCYVYAMVYNRPDLTHLVSVVSRFMSNHGKSHLEAINWILRHFNKMINFCQVYLVNTQKHLVGYADSNHGGDLVMRRSLTCYIFILLRCAIRWKSTLQDTVALSTAKSEYMSLMEGIKEDIFLNRLIKRRQETYLVL